MTTSKPIRRRFVLSLVLGVCGALTLAGVAPTRAGPPIATPVDEGKEQCGPAAAARGVWSLFGAGSGFGSIAELYEFLRTEMKSTAAGTDITGFIRGKGTLNARMVLGGTELADGTTMGLVTSGYAFWGDAIDGSGMDQPLDAADHTAALAAIRAALADPNAVVEVVVAFQGADGKFAEPHCYNATGVVDVGGGFGFSGVQDPVQGDGVAALEALSANASEQNLAGPFKPGNFGPLVEPGRPRVGYHVLYVMIEKKQSHRDGKPVTTSGTGTHGDGAHTQERSGPPAPTPTRPGRWSPSRRW
jgi:hypothetical protein